MSNSNERDRKLTGDVGYSSSRSTLSLVVSHKEESDIKPQPLPLTCRDWWLLFALCYVQFGLAACVSLQAPFFPREASRKGASATVYGLVFGVFELVIIISSPIYGKISGWVAPSFLVTSGVFVAGSCSILFGFLDSAPNGTPFIAMAFAVRIVEGLGCAATITASYTILAGQFPDRVSKTFSALETMFGLGLIGGPTIGGLLYEALGYTMPFATMGALMLIGSALCFFIIPESKLPEKKSGDLRKYVANWGVFLDSLSLITSLIFIGFNSATLEPHIRQFNLTPSIIGFVFVITGSIYGITTPVWGWICDKVPHIEMLIICGYALQCVNLVFLGPAPYIPLPNMLWLVILSLVIGGFGMSAKVVCVFINALKSSLERGFPNDITTHAMVSAMFATSCSIGAFIGPSLGGILLDSIGYRESTQVLLVIEILAMILTIWRLVYRIRSRNAELQPLLRQKSVDIS